MYRTPASPEPEWIAPQPPTKAQAEMAVSLTICISPFAGVMLIVLFLCGYQWADGSHAYAVPTIIASVLFSAAIATIVWATTMVWRRAREEKTK